MNELLRTLVGALAFALAALPGHAMLGGEPAQGPAAEEIDAAVAALKNKDWPGAISKLQAAERKDAKNAEVHSLLGYAFRKSGQLDKAFGHYRTALEIDPQHRNAHEYIGEAYLLARQPDKAREHLARLKTVCGEGCEEYQELAKAIAEYKP